MNYELKIKDNKGTEEMRHERIHNSSFIIRNSHRMVVSSRRGMVLVLSIIMLSMILSTSLGIFYIVFSGLRLAGTSRESQLAYYAADAGVECALYTDFRGDSSFGTSTAPSVASDCLNVSNVQSLSGAYLNGATFNVEYGNGSCSEVMVDKVSKSPQTVITSVGRNSCAPSAVNRVNRSIEVKY
jgi:Tfp pilus assembly protein PilX